jgi:putative aldouronate transport system substrate-binding protein
MKEKWTKPRLSGVILILVFSMAFSSNLFARGRQTASDQNKGLVTLDIYSGPSTSVGLQENEYWTEILKEDVGVAVNLLPLNYGEFDALMVSRQLPDIFIVHQYDQTQRMLDMGILLNLDEHKDKLPNVYANMSTGIQYYRDTLSNGTGGLYALPPEVGTHNSMVGNNQWGAYLRWDYYRELGMPELTNLEDFLPVIKQMVDAHPVTADGQRVYGFSSFSDWDGARIWPGQSMKLMYGVTSATGTYGPSYLEINLSDNSTMSMMDDRSFYKRALQFYFTANQMGILDPDAAVQRESEYMEKVNSDRVLCLIPSWEIGTANTPEKGAQGIGYRMVPFKNMKSYVEMAPYVGINAWSIQINKNTKKLDAALALVDYLCSYDGLWNLYNGRRGVKWDMDENGEPYLTRLGWDIVNGADYPNGGNDSGQDHIAYLGLAPQEIHPVFKRRLDGADWIKKDFAPADSRLDTEWKTLMQAVDDMDYVQQHNMFVSQPFAPMPAAPENIQMIVTRVSEVVAPLSWQMIYAKDQAEFDSLWRQMVDRARGLGVETANEWFRNEFQRSLNSSAKYMK